jgi:hypothetical protein
MFQAGFLLPARSKTFTKASDFCVITAQALREWTRGIFPAQIVN